MEHPLTSRRYQNNVFDYLVNAFRAGRGDTEARERGLSADDYEMYGLKVEIATTGQDLPDWLPCAQPLDDLEAEFGRQDELHKELHPGHQYTT